MKVLVTGATGFIGQHVVPELLKRGHHIVAVSRSMETANQFAWLPQVKFIPWDIHSAACFDLSEAGNPDALLHLAWPGLPHYKALFHFETNLPADYRLLNPWLNKASAMCW